MILQVLLSYLYFALSQPRTPSSLEFKIDLTEQQSAFIKDLVISEIVLDFFEGDILKDSVPIPELIIARNQLIFTLKSVPFPFLPYRYYVLRFVTVNKNPLQQEGHPDTPFYYLVYLFKEETDSSIYLIEDYDVFYDDTYIEIIQETIVYIFRNNIHLIDMLDALFNYRPDSYDEEIIQKTNLTFTDIILYVRRFYNIIKYSSDMEYVVLNQFMRLSENISLSKTDLTKRDMTYFLIRFFYECLVKRENKMCFRSLSERCLVDIKKVFGS